MAFSGYPRLILLAFCFCASVAAGGETPAPPAAAEDHLVPLEVMVNGAKTGTWLFVERAGALYAPREAFDEWRLQLSPSIQPIVVKGQEFWPLSGLAGFKAKTDLVNQSVELSFSPSVFAATRLESGRVVRPALSPVLPSLFLNYQLNYTDTFVHGTDNVQDLGALTELGYSTQWGVLTNTAVGRNLMNNPPPESPYGWVRLETTLTKDLPDRNATLRIGDASTRMTMWGRQVYFGGIQYGTNFALTPGFITSPLPALTGVSTAPSTVELYVNGVLSNVSNVPTGPFVIDNSPLLTGNGEARLVVRDLLGRETTVTLPFFTTTQLLAKGLDDWSVETGVVRVDLGLSSNHYDSGFASGLWRHGYSNTLTFETRAEATSTMANVGGGMAAALPWQLVGKAAVAASHEHTLGGGGLWLLGLQRQDLRGGAQIEVQGASIDFRQLGQDVAVSPLRLQVAANAYYTVDSVGLFGVGYATLHRYDDTCVTTLSGNYSRRVGQRGNLSFNVSHAVDGTSGTYVGLNYFMTLDKHRTVSATVSSQDGKTDYYATASQATSPESGLGWRLMAGRVQDQAHGEGGLYYQGRYGQASGELSTSSDQSTVRLGANGGLIFADGHLFATQRVDQSFAVAEVAGYGDVGIGLGSNVLSRTDANGVALVPHLAPYQQNSVRLDPRELPINAELNSIEQTVVPSWRSGVKVAFPVRRGRGALIKIVLDDGDVAPPGAIVQIQGDAEEFYVARRGEAFVTGLIEETTHLVLKWNDQQCRFDVALPRAVADDDIPRVGPLVCHGVTR